MFLSIVIPAWNEEKLLPATLAAIRTAAVASLEPAGITWELIVCDNNSTDSTGRVAAAHGAQVVFEPVNQIGRARNTGAAAATGDWLLFVDADSTPSTELFSDLARTLQNPQILGGGSLLDMPLEDRGARNALAIWHWISTRCRYAAGRSCLSGPPPSERRVDSTRLFLPGRKSSSPRSSKSWPGATGRNS